MRKLILAMLALVALVAIIPVGSAVASTPTVSYTGQGWIDDGNGGTILKDERCGVGTQTPANDGGTGQFANWNGAGQPYQTGQGYEVFVLSLNANPVGGVTIHLPDGEHPMIKVGGTWKYASPYFSHDDLVGPPAAHATFAGSARNAQLVVSHGCKPFDQEKPAWCSPGYWRNAADAAWTLAEATRADKFNATVVPSFYDTPYADNTFKLGNGPTSTLISDPSLQQVLENPGGVNSTESGPLVPNLNQFNATGAYLTDRIPGYAFVDQRDANGNLIDNCPIDNSGAFKVPQV
jgi:hypothetical protein